MESKKASLMYVLKVLEEYSDKDHFLTQKDILNKIYDKYGVSLERKSIGACLTLLEQLDYDIKRTPKGTALLERTFDDSEVRFLIDALFSSKSISGKHAKEISNKISNTLSIYERKDYSYLYKSSEVNRTANKDVFYNIDIINDAIKHHKWIAFKYLTYDESGKEVENFNGYVYHVSPCYLVNNFGKYYLLGYRNKYNSVTTYRIDKMIEVSLMEDRERLDPTTLEEFKNYKSISEYLNDHIYLFGGAVINAEMELKEPSALTYVREWFGNNTLVKKQNDKLVVAVRVNETAFFYWMMQYGEHVKLLSPKKMIDKVKEAAKNILETYK